MLSISIKYTFVKRFVTLFLNVMNYDLKYSNSNNTVCNDKVIFYIEKKYGFFMNISRYLKTYIKIFESVQKAAYDAQIKIDTNSKVITSHL